MRIIKELLFPTLCHRCMERSENFLCKRCIVGFDLAEIQEGDSAQLFEEGFDFIYSKVEKYQELIISCSIVQLSRLGWRYHSIYCEPELIFLRKALLKKLPTTGSNSLYLLYRKEKPILLEPMKKHRKVLFI